MFYVANTFAVLLQRGKTKQNKTKLNSVPGRDLESHNLGRECIQSLAPLPHCLGSQWRVSAVG